MLLDVVFVCCERVTDRVRVSGNVAVSVGESLGDRDIVCNEESEDVGMTVELLVRDRVPVLGINWLGDSVGVSVSDAVGSAALIETESLSDRLLLPVGGFDALAV